MIRVRAADGTIIHSMGPSFGEWLTYERDPADHARRDGRGRGPALPLASRRRSDRHRPRASGSASQQGRWRQGGSTITQQLARNIFLTNDRSFARKVREGILALALEWRFSKDQILELYLNRVYFGGGAYGIDAASRRFFGHSADRAQHRRGGDHRRPGQGAVQLFADRRRRGRARPRRRRRST